MYLSQSIHPAPCQPLHLLFFTQIEQLTGYPFSDEERKTTLNFIKIRNLRKRQFFLQEGDTCRHIAFVVQGAMKTYTINQHGHESILGFSVENEWVTDLESFMSCKHSNYHIEVLEHTELILLEKKQLYALSGLIPVFNELLRKVQYNQLVESQHRLITSISMNAEERYTDLVQTKPIYVRRFSQNMLASYLGIKPETLSRIRKNMP
jgi:CRP-like cAMP-binding protein